MIEKMFRKTILAATVLTAGMLMGCGPSSTGPEGGSKRQTATGVSASGYPAGAPKDAGSPALASSSETRHSREQEENTKVPEGSVPTAPKYH
jgi:hypothetical protein